MARAGRAVFEIGLDSADFQRGMKDLGTHARGAEGHLRGIRQALDVAIFTEFARIGVQSIGAVVTEIGELATRGAEVVGVRDSFDDLTSSIGSTSSAMLGELKGATLGLIGDFDLMRQTNAAIALDLPITEEEMGELAATAITLGRAMGQEAVKSVDDLIEGLGRGSTEVLDNLGIVVKADDAYRQYAEKIGKTAGELTNAEKKTAIYEAAMESARLKTDELGGVTLGFGDQLIAAKTDLQNLRDELSIAVSESPAFTAAVEAFRLGLRDAFGGDTQAVVGAVMGLLEDMVGFLLEVGDFAIGAAQVFVLAWKGAESGFNAVVGQILGGFGQIIDGVGFVIEAHGFLPGIGGMYEEAGAKVRGFGQDLLHLSEGFKTQAEDAWQAGVDTTNAMEPARTLFRDVKTALDEAGTAAVENSTKIRETAVAAKETATEVVEGTKQQTEELKRQMQERERQLAADATLIAETEKRLQQELSLAQTEGLQKRLLEIQINKEEELAEIESLRLGYQEEYQQLEAMILAKYGAIEAEAKRVHTSIEVAAAEQGFKTRAELEASAAKAEETYQRMLASGLFTIGELERAHQEAELAKQKITGESEDFQLTSGEAVKEGMIQILGQLGQHFKVAAIAGAIIATYSAVAKALAAAPWPANLPLAAGALAAGMANVAKIRGSEAGFAEGTPALDFARFGPASLQWMHGDEAVIPRGGGHQLALEIGESMPFDELVTEMRAMRQLLEAQPRETGRALRGALLHSS